MKHYTLGFVFNHQLDRVLLIKKVRSLHAGLWNGLGGANNPDESSTDCIAREVFEESNLDIRPAQWLHTANLYADGGLNRDPQWHVAVYTALAQTDKAKTTTDELTMEWPLFNMTAAYKDMAPHTLYLVYWCRDKLLNLPGPSRLDIFELR